MRNYIYELLLRITRQTGSGGSVFVTNQPSDVVLAKLVNLLIEKNIISDNDFDAILKDG